MENCRWWSSFSSSGRYYWLSIGAAAVGLAAIVFTAIVGGWAGYLSAGGLLLSSAGMFVNAREINRRQRLYGNDARAEVGDDILALLRQGRKIEAIKLYRTLRPGIGLREAKGVIDAWDRESSG